MKNKILEALLYVQGDEGLALEQVKDIFGLNTIAEARKVIYSLYASLVDNLKTSLKFTTFSALSSSL
ncbi:hypothetical protein [Mycoplasmopsis bovis]|uniref:hypothetical protein n=1 Tax=Mycoplasmopsis bovis TaxID=28903 RepID=UPI003D2A5DC8